MKSLHRRVSTVITICAMLFSQSGFTQTGYSLMNSSSNEDIYRSRISEYFYMRSGKEILKPVKLLGVVNKPGLYHIPSDTTLTSLMALSGGPLAEADMSQILISRRDGSVQTTDLHLAVKTGADPKLQDGDIVFVPKEKELMKASTSTMVIVVASLLTVLISGYAAFRND